MGLFWTKYIISFWPTNLLRTLKFALYHVLICHRQSPVAFQSARFELSFWSAHSDRLDSMHLILCNAFITLFLVYEACKTPHLYRSIDLHDQQSHGLKYYGELSSQRWLQDGMNAGRKETNRVLSRKEDSMKGIEKQQLGKIVFRKQWMSRKPWKQGWDVFIWDYSRLLGLHLSYMAVSFSS